MNTETRPWWRNDYGAITDGRFEIFHTTELVDGVPDQRWSWRVWDTMNPGMSAGYTTLAEAKASVS